MAKYHITKKGEPGLCRATKGACPLGGEGEHYPTREEAAGALEKKHGEEHSPLAGKKRAGKKSSPTYRTVDFMGPVGERRQEEAVAVVPPGTYRVVHSDQLSLGGGEAGERADALLHEGLVPHDERGYALSARTVDGAVVVSTYDQYSGTCTSVVSEDLYQSLKAAGGIEAATDESQDVKFELARSSTVGAALVDGGPATLQLDGVARPLDRAQGVLLPQRSTQVTPEVEEVLKKVSHSSVRNLGTLLEGNALGEWHRNPEFREAASRAYFDATDRSFPEGAAVMNIFPATPESVTERSPLWQIVSEHADSSGVLRGEPGAFTGWRTYPANSENLQAAFEHFEGLAAEGKSLDDPWGVTRVVLNEKPYFMEVSYE